MESGRRRKRGSAASKISAWRSKSSIDNLDARILGLIDVVGTRSMREWIWGTSTG